MATVILTGNGFGGRVQGNFGTYQADSSGNWTVDARDAPPLLAQGFGYVKQTSRSYAVPIAAAAATIGAIVASGALSNGTVAVTANPDVMRPVNVEVGTGTTAITAGTVAITYRGNDGAVATETLSLVCALSTAVTQQLSRGVVSISAIVTSGVVGGTSPWLRLSTTAGVAVPVDVSSTGFAVTREYDAGATIAIGTLGAALGSIVPTTAPNGTVTYSFAYSYTSPVT